MILSGSTANISVVAFALLYASNALGQSSDVDAGGFAAGTRYQLITADKVSFGPGILHEARTELLFKLSAADVTTPDEQDPDRTDKAWTGSLAFDRIDFLKPGEVAMYDHTGGLSYSAGIEVSSTDDFHSQSEIISSRQLGIHYGRLGSENYRSVDLGITNLSNDAVTGEELIEDKELWSLGVTTGRRFSLTGLDSSDPLWTVSLRGQFDVTDSGNVDEALDNQQWYVSPGLQWKGESFRLSADVLMPFIQSGELEEESDYRIRAKIQKRF